MLSADRIRIRYPQRHAAISALIKVPSAVPCCVRQGQSSPSAGFVSAAKSASIRIIRERRAHADRVMRGAQQRERVQHPAISCYVRLVADGELCRRLLCPDPFGIRPHARNVRLDGFLVELRNDILPRASAEHGGCAKQLPALRRRRFEPTGTGHMPFYSHDMSYRTLPVAASACEPCLIGMYNDQSGQLACKLVLPVSLGASQVI